LSINRKSSKRSRREFVKFRFTSDEKYGYFFLFYVKKRAPADSTSVDIENTGYSRLVLRGNAFTPVIPLTPPVTGICFKNPESRIANRQLSSVPPFSVRARREKYDCSNFQGATGRSGQR